MKTITQVAFKGTKTRLTLLFFVTLTVGAGFLLLFANDMLALVLNDYLMVQNFDGFARRILLTTGMFTLVYGMMFFGQYLRVEFEESTIMRLPHHYISKLLRAKHSYFTNRPAAEIHKNLWTASVATGGFYGNIVATVSRVVIFAFYGIVVFRIDIFAGLFAILTLPVYFLSTLGISKRVAPLQHDYVAHSAELATVTQEAFENLGNVKAKGAYTFFAERSARMLRKIKGVSVKVVAIGLYTANITKLIGMIAPLLIIFGAMSVSTGFEANAGNIMMLYINVPLFLIGFADIHKGYINYKMGRPFLDKLKEFDDAPLEDENGLDIAAFESLQTNGVSVEFEGGRTIIVPDFQIKQGEKIMFFGESGIGKSTVFNIIMGFQEYEGDIFVNGINLREISLASLRRVFGITFQHTNALTLNLQDNILLGEKKSENELQHIIQLCALEGQYDIKGDTALNNKVLSGGEKSRIGLSQMLAAKPQIMLIDEAFSNMDEELESKIIANLFKEYPKCAVICISHRNSSKPFFDRVVEF
ncbi:MAG: ABC transporter ATP-binding protein/permease [Defluviitaleaceae bacterium]|nr:ABC transporter ATP-binding protein/permease [Defluviitaleaceae bacterium]